MQRRARRSGPLVGAERVPLFSYMSRSRGHHFSTKPGTRERDRGTSDFKRRMFAICCSVTVAFLSGVRERGSRVAEICVATCGIATSL